MTAVIQNPRIPDEERPVGANHARGIEPDAVVRVAGEHHGSGIELVGEQKLSEEVGRILDDLPLVSQRILVQPAILQDRAQECVDEDGRPPGRTVENPYGRRGGGAQVVRASQGSRQAAPALMRPGRPDPSSACG